MATKICVIGANGSVGTELLRELNHRGASVNAAVRDLSKPIYADLPNVTPVTFDYHQPETFAEAMAGCDRLFLLSPGGVTNPHTFLNPIVDFAVNNGIRHIVLMTVMGTDADESLPLRQVERHIEQSGVGYTFVRPNFFMQNFRTFLAQGIREGNGIWLPAADGKTSFIDVRDIGAVLATVLTEGDRHYGQEYNLTGSEALSHAEVCAILSDVLGRTITFYNVTDEEATQALVGMGWAPDSAQLLVGLYYVVRQGWCAGITPDVETVLGRPPIAFRQFAEDNRAVWEK